MVDRATGRAVSSATFASRDAMVASRSAAQALRSRQAEDVGATVTDIHEFELALAHLHVPESVSDTARPAELMRLGDAKAGCLQGARDAPHAAASLKVNGDAAHTARLTG